MDPASTGSTNRVFYASGGTAPNRYMAIEWYEVTSSDELFTFETVLLENSDILFQYQSMSYNSSYPCGGVGIEMVRMKRF
jgi:hypothetical protein